MNMPYYLANYDFKQIKRDICRVVLCVAGFIMIMQVVSTTIIFIGVVIENPNLFVDIAQSSRTGTSFGLEQRMTELLADAYAKYGGIAMLSGMLCGLPLFFALRGKAFLTKDAIRVHSKAKASTLLVMLACVFAIQFAVWLVQVGAGALLDQFGDSSSSPLDAPLAALATSFWGVLYIVVIGPICEELVFRGAVMRKLERYGANFAIIVSSLLFGLYHLILFQAVYAFFIGIILAYTAGRFSLKWAALLHMINNGLAVLSLALGSEVFDYALVACFFVGFVATIIILATKGRKHIAAQRQAGAPSEPRVYARAFSSPWLIVHLSLCGIACILFSMPL